MRQAFLRRENLANGIFYGELIKEVCAQNDEMVHTELRLTIRGTSPTEFFELADWIVSNELDKLPRNMYVIQIPRAYRVLKAKGVVHSYGELLHNIFRPVFDTILDPSSHPALARFLTCVSGFDSVDDESIDEHEDGS